MQKILIIKLGALGDVIRTTPLLRVLKGEITWITRKNALPLLRGIPQIKTLLPLENAAVLYGKKFDLVISLDDEFEAAKLASGVHAKKIVGSYLTGRGHVVYTKSAAPWFDMGLISRFGKKRADSLKWINKKTYQEILFEMLGKKFKGEEYILPFRSSAGTPHQQPRVGLETRSGDRWLGKQWQYFPQFTKIIAKEKTFYKIFKQCPTLIQFIREVNKVDIVITPDTLTLHIALGLKKKVIALFTVTSPQEIYSYGRLTKIVSPRLRQFYYSTKPTRKSGEAISIESVYGELEKLL